MFHSIKARLAVIFGLLITALVIATCLILVSLTSAGSPPDTLTPVIILIILASLIITVIAALLISHSISAPLNKIISAVKNPLLAEKAFYSGIKSRDEIGKLARVLDQKAIDSENRISDLKRAYDDLSIIISDMSDGIIVVDRDRTVTMINDAAQKMLDINEKNTIGRTFIEAVLDYEINNMLQLCLQNRQKQTGLVITGPRRQTLGIAVTPMPHNQGCLILLQDLTDIQRFERERRDFLTNISHELRTPLSSIKALAETLKDGAMEDKKVAADFLGKIDFEVDRLYHMVLELGELSRIESGEGGLNRESFAVNEFLKQIESRLQTQIKRAGLTLKLDVEKDLVLRNADKNRMEQVIVNLLQNAIKFTPPGGTIVVSSRAGTQDIMFSVADTGIGISREELPRIFERFYKSDKARGGGGTGLGLSIAKKIVEAHGGNVRAESIEGRGSTFYFTLPL
jgi:two-component system phosphate regulon sensor histidine kinase PhoR